MTEEDFLTQNDGDTGKIVHFNSLLYRGIIKFERNKLTEAKKHLNKSLNIYTELPEANYYLALVYKKEADTSMERKYLETAQRSIESGFTVNEDNLYYVNYPFQITMHEIKMHLEAL